MDMAYLLKKALWRPRTAVRGGNNVALEAPQVFCYARPYYQLPGTKAPRMSILTYQYRVKDSTSGTTLARMAHAVNFVWNYCNEVSMLAAHRDKHWLSAFELINLVAGTSKALGMHTDTQSEVCREYATRRKQHKAFRLAWRSKKRSLGWVPFKGRCVRVKDDTVTYCGHTCRFWLSRPLAGPIKAGSFTQDARGRWYVNFQCAVDDPGSPLGDAEIGIDLGVTNQLWCSDMDEPYSRENLTRAAEDELARAQRDGKKRRIKALHARIANRRKDWTHKTTTAIVRRASAIVIGNVSSTKLAKTRMAKAVYDANWGQVRTCLHYKAIRLGVSYCEVNEAWSSVTCADCGARTGPRGLSALGVREWVCAACGVVHNRDHNASRNILRYGRVAPTGIP
jgi:IS605 OrfB family transposase